MIVIDYNSFNKITVVCIDINMYINEGEEEALPYGRIASKEMSVLESYQWMLKTKFRKFYI